ncbi:MAG: FliG C-terminal domain-containing protein [Roseinatronobacter sp.]
MSDERQLAMAASPAREIGKSAALRATSISAPPAPAMASSRKPIRIDHLSGVQKASIIVRLMLSEGMDIQISRLPSELQAELTQTIGKMGLVDRATMCAVVDEFADTLEQVGLSFPDGLDAALSLLDGKLDANAAQSLRSLARGVSREDPWATLERAEIAELQALITREAEFVSAVLLSKLSAEKAARLLRTLSAEQAQALALSISQTEDISPDVVARIGATLADQVCDKPARAFLAPPSKRMGEILNASPAQLRDQVLRDLEVADKTYAGTVRQAIFTYQDIPLRIVPRDVPAIMRLAGNEALVAILASGQAADSETSEFLLQYMSKRIAETIREDVETATKPDHESYEAAISRFVTAVRSLVDEGKITLLPVKA